MEKLKNYINGKLVASNSKDYIKNINPATGTPYSLIPNSNQKDIDEAVQSAQNAFISWSKTSKEERFKVMMQLAETIDKHSQLLIESESRDNGKPEWLAKQVDIPRCSANIRFFATAMLHFDSKIHEMDGKALNYTLRQPIGVAACISPWNLPLYLLTWKIAPAIAAGNTVVAKPSEITPYTAYLFSKICIEAKVPKGIINIVHGIGREAGQMIVEHKDVPVVSFTGGTETGKNIANIAAKRFKKVSLELGGKNPNIIFADTDFEKAINMAVKASFSNQGQICLCGSRIFIEEAIYIKFKKAFVKKTKQLIVGNPKNKKSDLGAVVSEEHMEKILLKIKEAKEQGGKILCGGKRIYLQGRLKKGYYIAPTIIENLPFDCNINQEEIFGPVVSIMPFKTEEEVIRMSNSTKYGLSASIFTNDVSRAHRVASKIDAGIVWINTWLLRDLRIPFGGMKQSGIGREGGFHSLNFFTEAKNVCIKI